MPNKPTSRPLAKTTPKQHHWPLIILGVLILLIMGGLIGWKIYHNNLVAQDKARFAQAERDVDELSKAVVAAVGEPAKVTTEKYCSRPNIKFEEGPLSCNIDKVFEYGVVSTAQASQLFEKSSSQTSPIWKFVQNDYSSNSGNAAEFLEMNTVDYNSNSDYQQKIKRYESKSDIPCSVVYVLFKSTAPPSGYLGNSRDPLTLNISIICGDRALIAHFPVKS